MGDNLAVLAKNRNAEAMSQTGALLVPRRVGQRAASDIPRPNESWQRGVEHPVLTLRGVDIPARRRIGGDGASANRRVYCGGELPDKLTPPASTPRDIT